jgi:transcriptional regulator with XRE-family HTH domain
MPKCSRCGAQDDKHTMKCYKAMVLGRALGVEPLAAPVPAKGLHGWALDDEVVAAPAREYAPGRGFPAIIQDLRSQLAERQQTIMQLRQEVRDWRFEVEELRRKLDAWITPEGIYTRLAPGYYDEKHVAPERLAEIQAEVDEINAGLHDTEILEAMEASPNLDVIRHPNGNASVVPKRDDDYTPEAVDRTEPDGFDLMRDFLNVPQPQPEPAPVLDGTDWPTFVRELRAARKWSQNDLAGAVGCARSMIGFWEQGKYKPGPELAAKLRQLATETPEPKVAPEPEPQPEPVAAAEEPEFYIDATGKRVPRNAAAREAMVGVPGAWARPETKAAEDAAQEFVDQFLVPAEGTRADEKGSTWQVYVTAPELQAAYEAWAAKYDKPITKGTFRFVGQAATRSPIVKKKWQGPRSNGAPAKPICYAGVKLLPLEAEEAPAVEPEAPKPTPADLDPTARIRSIMQSARTVREETIPEPDVEIPHGPDELATKLAQLKHFGIGGAHGVSKVAAQTAIDGLHPTGRDVWKWSPPQSTNGVSDADLDATAYQLLVKCMNGLPEEFGYDYKDDVLATAGFQQEDVDAALRNPQRVEIRPESWDREKRYPILGFHRGDVSVILGLLTPAKPRVIAAYWTSLLSTDTHRVNHIGGGGSKKSAGLPSNPGQVMARLRAAGCEIPEPVGEKPVDVTYKGQGLGKIMTARTTTKITAQADYQRTLRKMQAIDRREVAKAG